MQPFFTYLETLAQTNGLGDGKPVQWLFYPGMLFLSPLRWWGSAWPEHQTVRASVHEGLDITYYRTVNGHVKQFAPSIQVPALDNGVVLNICNDFLGQTLVVEPCPGSASNTRVIFTYAHITAEPGLKIQDPVKKNQVIAKVCDASCKNPEMPSHLHFSCFEVDKKIPLPDLNWDLFSASGTTRMINPLFM